ISEGTLRVAGIELRDVGGKIRYILKGFENLPQDASQLSSLPSLVPLQAAMNIQQIMGIVSIAQSVAIAASLRRIEQKLDDIETRLGDLDRRLSAVDSKLDLLIEFHKAAPIGRLKSAERQAIAAFRDGDRTALNSAGTSADRAVRDLLALASALVRQERVGLSLALQMPQALGDIILSVMDALEVASAIYIALKHPDIAARMLDEAATEIERMRKRLATSLMEPTLLLERSKLDATLDPALRSAGQQMGRVLEQCRGRKILIEMGIIGFDPLRQEFETISHQEGLAIQRVPEQVNGNYHR
ncbi:MAG: hypothetical protein QOJ54_2385, partial [Aliidongia sp.]|nr:hypothetical protein [Aliidongia sp.]